MARLVRPARFGSRQHAPHDQRKRGLLRAERSCATCFGRKTGRAVVLPDESSLASPRKCDAGGIVCDRKPLTGYASHRRVLWKPLPLRLLRPVLYCLSDRFSRRTKRSIRQAAGLTGMECSFCHPSLVRPEPAGRPNQMKPEPEEVYGSFMNAAALIAWLPPAGMTGEIRELDARAGRGHRRFPCRTRALPAARLLACQNLAPGRVAKDNEISTRVSREKRGRCSARCGG